MVTSSKLPIALAWVLAMMMSPEGLALQGNLAGKFGGSFFLPLVAAFLIHVVHIAVSPGQQQGAWRQTVFRGFGVSLVSLIALPGVAVCMATATLVTSGFVFNEVFVYWFPNFGFAAILLLGLLALNLAGRRIAAGAQILFTATALIGLAGLTLAGAFGSRPQTLETTIWPRDFDFKGVGWGAAALLGYDLLRYATPDLDCRRARHLMGIGLAAGGVLIWAWNTTALAYVPASRLADTGIPHILAAKTIWGQNGRLIMGIVVIAGSLAAVNLLFRAVAQMLNSMAQSGLMPAMAGISSSRPWLPFVVLTGLTGLLMATGFAGTDWLDIVLRAGLILWLVSLGLAHLPPLMTGSRRSGWTFARAAVHIAILVTMTTLGIIMVFTDDDPGRLARALLTLIAIAAGLALIGLIAAQRRPANRRRKVSPTTEGVLR